MNETSDLKLPSFNPLIPSDFAALVDDWREANNNAQAARFLAESTYNRVLLGSIASSAEKRQADADLASIRDQEQAAFLLSDAQAKRFMVEFAIRMAGRSDTLSEKGL